MIALLQRVKRSSVHVNDLLIAEIKQGLLVFLGIEKSDTEANARRLLERVLGYRVFQDDQGKMNQSLLQQGAGLLIVPQFTLVADTKKGMRPGFSSAAAAGTSRRLYDGFVGLAQEQYKHVASGQFGADMQVSLVNDGPVTFWLQSN